jgi:hypothetical protein
LDWQKSTGPCRPYSRSKFAIAVFKTGHFDLEHDLIVSSQHGVLLQDPNNGGSDVLYRARYFVETIGGDVRIMRGCRRDTYFHILLDQHEVVFSNGMASASLYLGPIARQRISAPARRKMLPDHLDALWTTH